MTPVIVVNNAKKWPLRIPGVWLVGAREYLTDSRFGEFRGMRVFNLCRSFRYQSTGYYVSLLAMARGHRPMPSITTIQDLKTSALARIVGSDLDELIHRSLRPIEAATFTVSIYFGRNLAKRYDELSGRLFGLIPAPLLRAEFSRERGEWSLVALRAIAANDVPPAHQSFIAEAATAFFSRNRWPQPRRSHARWDLAILCNRNEALAPSNRGALRHFSAAARRQEMSVTLIGREDYGRVGEFDALFIRETTAVHHHTYRFARRAAAEGLVVMDDPESITKCSNKVYLAELLARQGIPHPTTLIVHRDNRDEVAARIGFPCVVKEPDSSFSRGVEKVDGQEALDEALERLLERSDLVIAQAFLPTDFDWRIGVVDRQPLYACQYFMVKRHWQIAKNTAGSRREGTARAVPLEDVPKQVVRVALNATRLIGDGLYGVDVKQVGRRPYIIEINDNPNIDAGVEDRVLGLGLYDRIMQVFSNRLAALRNGRMRGVT